MMKFQVIFLLGALLLFIGCTQSPNSTISLSGSDWQFAEVGETMNWKDATVPGTVQTDLLHLAEIPHPFLGTNEDSIQWISERDWMYKKEFQVASEVLEKNNHWLKFEGLDTYAEVRFNDSLILNAANAFRTYEIDVSKILKQKNQLSITFRSTTTKEKQLALQLPYQLPEAPRVFTRKPQFQYGWDWGPTIKTMGVWRDISLVSYHDVRIKDVYFETQSISKDRAQVTAHIALSTFDYDKSTIEVMNETTGEVVSKDIEIYRDETYEFPITIRQPQRWWTHNLGDPFLYHFTVRLKNGNRVVDKISQKVGLRTIELITEKDSLGESFYFKLNDVPVYMKGANYIPQNIFLPQVTTDDREQLLDDAVAANMNMLRVWGGGVYEDDSLYELCDEKGILLWQDFMFACAMYPGDASFLENVKAEAIDNVKRLRKHPSIALWCGNNENSEGWHRWGWQEGKTAAQRDEIWSNYQKLFQDILPSVVDSLHGSVSYWESSPKFGRGDTRYQYEGDAHDWWVWHDGYPFEHFEKEVPRFMSEFGFQAFPSVATLKHFMQQDTIDLSHPSMISHQKHARGFQIIRDYMARDYPVPTNAEDYVYVSQLLQAHGITMGVKAHRRAKPYNMGTLYWQLNDCWPAISWSSIDAMGSWKALHYKVKESFNNRSIIAWEDHGILKVKVVDDSLANTTDELLVRFKDFEGDVIYESNPIEVTTGNELTEVVYEVELSTVKFNPRHTVAEVSFGTEKALFYFVKPKDLLLSATSIAMNQQPTSEGVNIELSTSSLQKDVYLMADVPGHFSDNYFDLLPGELKTVQFIPDSILPINFKYKTLNKILLNPTFRAD